MALLISPAGLAETVTFNGSWGEAGFNLVSQDAAGVKVVYSIEEFALEDMVIDGQTMQMVYLPGVILPNAAGAPNLPGLGRYVAIPQGASVRVKLVDFRTEVYQGVDLAPAPPIQFDTDDSPPVYEKDPAIYSHNAYYPENPVRISEPTDIRGVDVVILGITPFQYNPVTGELLVYRDLRIQVDFIGGNGHFGEDRLRSRYWEPILKGNLLNYASLPEINFNRIRQTDEDNVEYLIIVPDDPDFLAWADSIKAWRTQQGIFTGITTLAEIGGNNSTLIENYINNAYATWDPAPVAVLLLSDYQSSGDMYGITSPIYNYSWYSCVSDNIYADINGNDLPDIAFARITAQDDEDLATMIGKMLDYERQPPTDPGFYDHPVTAGGWQTARWFILCCEVIWGYWHEVHGKDPVREYAIYSGYPSGAWSSNSNTYMIVNYFGPNGLGYIPDDPEHLTEWGANATRLNNDINNGAFFVQHRDHGSIGGWGEPSYNIGDLNGLNNDMLPFVFSINCLTGKYNHSSACFTEAFHRMEHGALGLIAASETSYSFVNDTYVWGMFDSMYPDFDPGYGTDETGINNMRTCFANAYGKYYLSVSNWPYNPSNKDETYHLFHHHGDAFITVNSEVPQDLTVTHDPTMLGGVEEFTVTSDQGSIIALTVEGEIIGVAEGTGAPVNIEIEPQVPGVNVLVTATLYNHFRYTAEVPVIASGGAYVVFDEVEINDASGNNNGQLNPGEDVLLTITVENIGGEDATNVEVTLTTDDTYTTVIDSIENYGNIAANSTAVVTDGFEIAVDPSTPNNHFIAFTLTATDGDSVWVSGFNIETMPDLELTLTPVGPPIQIPSNGGSFEFNIAATNNGSAPATFDLWTMATLPDGRVYGPIISVSNFTLNANSSVDRDRTQFVGSGAPTGNYTYDGYIGNYPNDVWVEDHFDFEKLAVSDGGPVIPDWANWGESFDDLLGITSSPTPLEFSLHNAYPNPFNPETSISFTVPEACRVNLTVYNLLGHKVVTLYEGMAVAGYHRVIWNASDMSSGVYFYHLQAGDYSGIRKCILMK